MLDSITVKGYRHTTPLKIDSRGIVAWKTEHFKNLPQILSNADPMHYIQMLPGVQTNSEYRSGLNIEGCDNQHNMISLQGVPIYNVNHLLGFFSSFNVSHFPVMTLHKTHTSDANRIGCKIDMQLHHQTADTLSYEISLGLLSSQGTLRMPLDSKTSATISLRGSYMNLLYSNWLKADDQTIRYSFYDINFTLTHQPNSYHTLLLNIYHGGDRGRFTEQRYMAAMHARWGNTLTSLHWFYDNEQTATHMESKVYVTSYQNHFQLQMPRLEAELPSSITDIGISSNIQYKQWTMGLEVIRHLIRPQYLEYTDNLHIQNRSAQLQQSAETTASVAYQQPIGKHWEGSAGLRMSTFFQNDASYWAFDPSVSLRYFTEQGSLLLNYAFRHQYLFQTGFSNVGLPSEFWMSASNKLKPQYAHIVSIEGNLRLFKGRYFLTPMLFYRKLYHQVDYQGSVLDCLSSNFKLDDALRTGSGENTGVSIMLRKTTGKLTGWINYTYTHARRHFEDIEEGNSYPPSHERPHEVNLVTTYMPTKHWSFGTTAVYASGIPYTKAELLYILNKNIIMHYGKHNASRMKPYIRMDLSANYRWYGKRGCEHGLNLSVYNVTCRENELFYYLQTNSSGSFAYRPLSFVLRILPSVSYSCKF